MDRKSIFGVVLIAAIFIIWGIIQQPNQEQIKRNKFIQDSIAQVEQQQQKEAEVKKVEEQAISKTQPENDSAGVEKLKQSLGEFSDGAVGQNHIYTIENELIRFKISAKGGRPYSVELKKYTTFDSLPVMLFKGDSTVFGLNFYSQNRLINTNDLYFNSNVDSVPLIVKDKPQSVTMRLAAGPEKYIEYHYTLQPDKYEIDLDVKLVGMKDISTRPDGVIDLDWQIYSPQQEKGRDNEMQYTNLYYKPYQEDVDYFGMSKKNLLSEDIKTKVEWIAYKDQFFSSVLMADSAFTDANMEMHAQPENSRYLKMFKSSIGLAAISSDNVNIPLHFYFGPNKYRLLKSQYGDKSLQDLVSVGRNIIKWINHVVIISLFDFLNKYFVNYGIIILLMTIIIKIFLLPLTYKSYLSTAKMRVLKPQIDEITAKIPKEKAMERQQATMALYKKVGVSPLGGCLPMLLQMPILFAMFRFFPTSIELRHQGFLWAHDLSTYDSILTLPFVIPWYGNHVSLFTILMTISTILSMKLNNQTASNPQMPGMQTMMYIMPVMMMFFLNKFSAGLTYYYFLANVITIGQNYLFNLFINEEELLKKLQSKKAKPVKKSNFQKRLEEMAKTRGMK